MNQGEYSHTARAGTVTDDTPAGGPDTAPGRG